MSAARPVRKRPAAARGSKAKAVAKTRKTSGKTTSKPGRAPARTATARSKAVPQPRLQLAISDRYRPRSEPRLLRAAVATTLAFAGRPDKAVSLLLTDDAGIAQLHADYLGDPTPTDVMSFDVDDTAEIVVSVQTARRVAAERGHRARAELALYVVHGLLHTLGYDDLAARDRARMRRAERAVLQQLGLVVHAVDA
jgi:probable rRNA maturation factor